MRKLKLTLADPDGVVLSQWTIGRLLEEEHDIEDLDTDPDCNFYLWGNYNDGASIGEEVVREGQNWFDNHGEKICDKCGEIAIKLGASFGEDDFLRLNYHCENCNDTWSITTEIQKQIDRCTKCGVKCNRTTLRETTILTCPECGAGWSIDNDLLNEE